ncbi:Six-hairpin glycosidase-like protein [Halenospora varia]|nr:Six-hairpin glycosidase-like protein [Halenospora varia]
MLKLYQTIVSLVSILFAASVACITLPQAYDVSWTTQSENSAGSMPLGGGGIGLNVWSENDTILFYIAKGGTFDENNSMLKLGRVRLTIDPNPFSQGTFKQTLKLNDGYILFEGAQNATLKLWVDVFNPVIHVELNAAQDVSYNAAYESWRFEDRLMNLKGKNSAEQGQSSCGQDNCTTRGDDIAFYRGGVRTTHHNLNSTIFDFTVAQQHLQEYASSMYNPLSGNTFGLWMYSPDLVPGNISSGNYVNTTFHAWNLHSQSPKSSYSLQIVVGQSQEESASNFQAKLDSVAQSAGNNSQAATINWWHGFWDRSYIIINENSSSTDGAFQVGKNYQIFRYMQGCNAFSEWPLRFNGGLWTFDPVFVNPDTAFTPDYRGWTGGTFTAQNQRLVYWPLLKSGDFDLMKSAFDFYKRITPNARLRGNVYFGLNATVFTEQIENYGLPSPKEYNGGVTAENPRPESFPVGIQYNAWLEFLQDTANEFADMILQASMFDGMDVGPYMEFIEHQLMWFDLFYQQQHAKNDIYPLTGYNYASNSGNGSLVIYPGSGAETYKSAYNPSSTISGLRKVLKDLLQVAPEYQVGNKSYYEGYLQRVPETPLRFQQGRPCISPAQGYSRIQNVEIPQLYPVFPWGEYGLGQPNLTVAVNTYLYDTETQDFHKNVGWTQDVIWMARMGLTATAKNMTLDRWSDSTIYRFPVFKGPNFDWSPDINHYGSASIALQEMLLQTYVDGNKQIRVGGAWPEDWSVRFKLHAPGNTTVVGKIDGGKVGGLVVSPEERDGDVVVGSA